MKSFEIFFNDLTSDAQNRFLETFNMKKEDGNFDALAPLAIVDMEDDEDDWSISTTKYRWYRSIEKNKFNSISIEKNEWFQTKILWHKLERSK